MPGLFPCLCGAITELFFAIGPSDVGVDLVGSTFNIQNFIPHKSQKTKAVAEASRVKEFQRGTVGATESTKESTRVLAEGSDIGLGPGDRAFESPHSDQGMIIRTTLSRWVMCSDLSFLLRMYCRKQKGGTSALLFSYIMVALAFFLQHGQ